MILSEQPIFRRTLRHGKPTGAAVLTGFTLKFNMPLATSAVSKPANYELDVVAIKKVRKSIVRVLTRSITSLSPTRPQAMW